jgi:hypothetical protein
VWIARKQGWKEAGMEGNRYETSGSLGNPGYGERFDPDVMVAS